MTQQDPFAYDPEHQAGQPQAGQQPPQYGQQQPQYGQPQYGQQQPQYGQQQPQYGQPQYGQPQYGPGQYGQQQYGPPNAGMPGQAWQPWQAPNENRYGERARLFGFLSFVLGIFTGIPALIFGIKGLGAARRGSATNRGWSIFGVVMGALTIVATLVFVAVAVSSDATRTFPGDELAKSVTDTIQTQTSRSVSNVNCPDTHNPQAGTVTTCTALLDDQLTVLKVHWNGPRTYTVDRS